MIPYHRLWHFSSGSALCAAAVAFCAAACTHPDQGDTQPSGASGTSSSGTASGSSGAATGSATGNASTGSSTGTSATGATGTAGSAAGATSGASTGAASGTSGTAGKDAAVLTRGPTPSTSTTKYPFPQNRQGQNCIFPTAYDNDAVQAAYQQWKTDLVVSAGSKGEYRVQRTSTDLIDTCRPLNSTVSEGIGYGMLIAVYMDDQSLFDGLWLYEQENIDPNGLMNWAPGGPQDPGGSCGGGATDADEDMAFALVMADAQWGGQGSLSKPYKQIAISQIQTVWANEIAQYKYVLPGESTWAKISNLNPSYLAPAYYRVFATVDPNSGAQPKDDWMATVDQSYATINDALNNGNASNGLVPAWCNDSNAGSCPPGQPGNYQYDSCRIPFRIGLDWCWSGETRAQSYVAKTSTFFSGVGAANIVDGYGLDGTPQPTNMNSAGQSAAFIGPAGVGAMSASTYQSFVDDAYGLVATDTLRIGGAYYEESWTVMSLLMMSANFLNYASTTP
jgi:endo-1,4-beta-D-glucanase Y